MCSRVDAGPHGPAAGWLFACILLAGLIGRPATALAQSQDTVPAEAVPTQAKAPDAAARESALQMRGNVSAEYLRLPRFETDIGGMRVDNPLQPRENIAVKGLLDASVRMNANWNAAARLFVREDVRNDDRDATRADELWVQYGTADWDLRVGNQLVTWGSVESVSPLDIINPRDYEEDIVEPVKIGIGMARARLRLKDSDLSLYWLPAFKPSQYAGPHSYYAIGGGLPNHYPGNYWDASQWAVRYFRSADDLDLGISFVHALERNASFDEDPSLQFLQGSTYRSKRLGSDITYVTGDLVLKLEAVYRTSDEEGNRKALLYALGLEYSLSAVWRHSDLSFFAEWLGTSHNVRDIEL